MERNDPDILQHALVAGAAVDHLWTTLSSSSSPRTPLQLAAETGQLDLVRILLEHGSDINAPAAHSNGRTALQAAASSTVSCIEVVKLLLSKGAEVNAMPAAVGGVTALQGAAIQGNINVAWLLIEKGADVNAAPSLYDGRSAVEGAAERGRLDMVHLLLNLGARGDVSGAKDNGPRGGSFDWAISLADRNGHSEIVDLLKGQRGEGR